MSQETLSIIQIVLSLILIALIIIQAKGNGLGANFSSSFNLYQTRRGVEKILFYLTMIIGSLFLIVALVRLVI